MRTTLNFTECEHEGDLDMYLGDLRKSGAKIEWSDINFDAETGEVCIEVEDVKAFKEAFEKTLSFEFTNIY